VIKRRFSRWEYNGYHLVSIVGEGANDMVGLFKKSKEKDEFGFLAVEEDSPRCPHSDRGAMRGSPWDNWLYVPSVCQSCPWVYRTPESNYDCLLKTRENVHPGCLVNQGKDTNG
jgi:hypothetical protein